MSIRVGILGCANIAKRSLAPAFYFHPSFEVCAVASRSLGKARDFVAEVSNECKSFSPRIVSYEDLIKADDVDFIYCPLPTGLHYEWVKRCLDNGKHVLCEKSLACSCADVRSLVETAKAHGLFLMESFQFQFHPQNRYVKELLENDAIGDVRQVVVRFGMPPFPDGRTNIRYDRSLGGGALLDAGAYTIKAASYLFDEDFTATTATAFVPDDEEVDCAGLITLRSTNGIVVQTAYGFDHFYQNGYEIWGSRGMIKTSRAFTARSGYAAEVVLQTNNGVISRRFDADHFALMLDYVAHNINQGKFDCEYAACLSQARIMGDVRKLSGLV